MRLSFALKKIVINSRLKKIDKIDVPIRQINLPRRCALKIVVFDLFRKWLLSRNKKASL